MKKRNLPSIIDAYHEFLEPQGVPPEYRRWAALWAVSAAAERRYFLRTARGQLFPNLFIIIAGKPANGKGLALQPVRSLIAGLGPHYLGASSMTKASLIDGLNDSQRSIINQAAGKTEEYNCLNICSPEFQVLFPAYDTAFLATLTDVYDGFEFSETLRGRKSEPIVLPRALMTMLAATTPEHFFSTFPESAWRTGFMSRAVLIWGSPIKKTDFLPSREELEKVKGFDKSLYAKIAEDLKSITEGFGEFFYDEHARQVVNKFLDDESLIPAHPHLRDYTERRGSHVMKVCMNLVLSNNIPEFAITAPVAETAIEYLLDAETMMPDFFKDYNAGGDVTVIKNVHHQLWVDYLRHKKAIPRSRVENFLLSHVKSFQIPGIINVMLSAKWIKSVQDKKFGICYIPLAEVPADSERKMKGE